MGSAIGLWGRWRGSKIGVMSTVASRLKIVVHPDPVLRQKALPVDRVTDEVRAVARRMIELMHEAPGVGLAAPQVGLSWRLFVANDTREPGNDKVFINPVLSDPTREVEDYEEGCLSLPGVTAHIRRPKGVTIDAVGLDGKPFRIISDDFAARVWQHEYDHLDGVMILDRMTPIDRMANRRAIKELEAK